MSLPKYRLLVDEEKQNFEREEREISSNDTLSFANKQFTLQLSGSKIVAGAIWALSLASLGVLIVYTLVWPDNADEKFVPDCKCLELSSTFVFRSLTG